MNSVVIHGQNALLIFLNTIANIDLKSLIISIRQSAFFHKTINDMMVLMHSLPEHISKVL